MRKKNNHNRKQTASSSEKKTNTPSKIIFTMPVVKILKDSLATFEILLLANENKTIPNLEFAHLTFHDLKQKLTDMLEREEWNVIKAFDYNEIWILYTSLAMYIVDIQINHRGDSAKLGLCLALCNQFNAMIETNR